MIKVRAYEHFKETYVSFEVARCMFGFLNAHMLWDFSRLEKENRDKYYIRPISNGKEKSKLIEFSTSDIWNKRYFENLERIIKNDDIASEIARI